MRPVHASAGRTGPGGRGIRSCAAAWIVLAPWGVLPPIDGRLPGASAQELSIPVAVPRPALDDQSWLRDLLRRLEHEIAESGRRSAHPAGGAAPAPGARSAGESAPEARAVLLRAMAEWRLLAAETLRRALPPLRAGEATDEDMEVALAGMRLANGRHTLDRALLAAELDPARRDGAIDAAHRFVAAVVDHVEVRREAPVQAFLQAVRGAVRVLAPIGDGAGAACWLEGAPTAPHPDGSTPAAAPLPAGAGRAARLAAIAARARDAADGGAIAAAAHRLADGLDDPARAEAIDRAAALLDLALDLQIACTGTARWMDPPVLAWYRGRIDAAIATTAAPPPADPSGDGATTATDLRRSALALAAVSAAPDAPTRRTLGRVLARLEGPAAVPLADRARRIEWFTDLVTTLDRSRHRADERPPRDFAQAAGALDRLARIAERTLINELDRLATDAGALSDPGFLAAVSACGEYRRARLRLYDLDRWVSRMAAASPRARSHLLARMRTLGEAQADPIRRDAAMRVLRRLERQVARFDPMPFESRLAEPDAVSIRLSSGVHDRLHALILSERRLWVEAWAVGEPDAEQLRRLELLFTLMRALDEAARSQPIAEGAEGFAAVLERWALVEIPAPLRARIEGDLPTRLRVACAAAADGDWRGLAHQVERLERDAPVTRVLLALSAAVAARVSAPAGAWETLLCRCGEPAPEGAFLRSEAARLADLSLFVIEADTARRLGRRDEAAAAEAYAGAVALRLLSALEGERPAENAPVR
ncbi:MAG: hypothetical protein KF817_08805 [Phycisphaeraceae bacterium]|nr:hypothetical protein [Phycisphaeraceae bacterium]